MPKSVPAGLKPFRKGVRDPRQGRGPAKGHGGRPPKDWLAILGTYEEAAAHTLGKAAMKDWRAAERVAVLLHGQPKQQIDLTGQTTLRILLGPDAGEDVDTTPLKVPGICHAR